MATESVNPQLSAQLLPHEALARLCNAECMLELTIQALDATALGGEEWKVSEALHGVRRLLDGCYVALAEEVEKSARERAPA